MLVLIYLPGDRDRDRDRDRDHRVGSESQALLFSCRERGYPGFVEVFKNLSNLSLHSQ